MTSEEKKELLGKIQTSLNLSARDVDGIVSKSEGPDGLKHRLTKELNKLGFLDRMVLRLTAFFRNRTEYEVMGDRKLLGPRTVLRDQIPALVSFSREEWSPEFAKVVYDLYAEAQAIRPLFDHLFQQKLTLEAGMVQMIRDEYPGAIRGLGDLFPEDEIAACYRTDQRRQPLQNQLDRRLEVYLSGIPPVVFEKVKDRLKPLYYLRPLVQFPYAFLLDLFGHNPDKVEVAKYPYFIGTSWRKSAALLERLYYGLHLASKVDWREGTLNAILQGAADRIGDEKASWTLETANQRLTSLVRTAQEIGQRLPWKEVLQWSFQDPYYGVKYILPRFSIRDFYETTLVMSLREELDSRIPEVRQALLGEERSVLFQDGSFAPLEYYVPGVGSSLSSQKVKGFQYPESLGLLWGFLSHHFTKKIVPFHQSLVRMVAPGNKSVLQALGNVVEELGDLKTKIHQFDRTLHPDSQEGKDFQKLKYELASKALSLKPFIELVQGKDAQASALLNRGLEGLQMLQTHLEGVRSRNVPALNAALKLPYLLEGQQETIENGLDRILVIVQKTLFVLREAQHLED
jgi:hypothetical protein